ncbi:MAG: lysostaphin resistance A-like protein [Cellulosilyticaceae bacterium]
MNKLFIGEDGKLRPWIQIILIYAATMMAQVMVISALTIPVGIYMGVTGQVNGIITLTSEPWFLVLTSTAGNVVNIIVTVLLYKLITHQPAAHMGLTPFKTGTKQFVGGLVLGMASIAIMIGVLTLTGDYTLEGIYVTKELLLGLILFLAVGFGEEILVRGAFQHLISAKHHAAWAILIPSAIFSAMHLGNPNVAPLAVVNLFLAGVMLGVITYKTGNLWMGIGWHITWNFTMGNLFGVEVSGLELGKGLIQMNRVKDNLMNGGNFGLEGGYLCSLLLIIMILLFAFLYKKQEA